MRRRALSLALGIVCLIAPAGARAATVDIVVLKVPETTDWRLIVEVAPGATLTGVFLHVSSTLETFMPTLPQEPSICVSTACFGPGPSPGLNSLSLGSDPGDPPLALGGNLIQLGIFGSHVGSAEDVGVFGVEPLGATALQGDVALDYSIRVVPEPGAVLLVLAAAALAAAARLTRP